MSTPPLYFFNDSSSIRLRILVYQYSDNSQSQYDADWLRVEDIVTHPKGNWRFNDPCLLTWEALALAEWLDSWDQNNVTEIAFIEPNLSFARIDSSSGRLLRISFELESRPPWAEKRFVGPSDTWLDLLLQQPAAITAAGILRDQLRRFPIKVGP